MDVSHWVLELLFFFFFFFFFPGLGVRGYLFPFIFGGMGDGRMDKGLIVKI
jgi:hypothetical protein